MPRALTSSDIETIRWHAGRGVKPGTIAQWYGVGALDVRAIINQTAPSGAPAADEDQPRNAGTATAEPEETGHRPQGSDEVPPLREVEGLVLQRQPSANHSGQSGRPTHSLQPVALPQRVVRPPVAPSRSARRGSAMELAEIADAAAMRSRHDAMRDAEHSWRGRKVAPSTASPNP